uniref:Carbonic anhydrase n=1 Tax=Caligus clemensi TaxID=344056 RepID=C1C2M7_CALCM|nr:Carbonic anhydrase [Caligus clemensi]
MDKVLRGILQYNRSAKKKDVLKQLSKIVDSQSTPSSVLFTCMDSRIHPNVFMNSDIGDAFTVRNAGNIVPKSGLVHGLVNPAPEPAGLELGCVLNSIKNVIVCGHSDCKAMIAVHSLKDSNGWSEEELLQSPLKAWLYKHGMDSLNKLNDKLTSPESPLTFMKDTQHEFEANMDNKLLESDQLSQINTLVQIENIYSYGFMKERMDQHQSVAHGLWLSLSSGEAHFFSKKDKAFVNVTEDNVEELVCR